MKFGRWRGHFFRGAFFAFPVVTMAPRGALTPRDSLVIFIYDPSLSPATNLLRLPAKMAGERGISGRRKNEVARRKALKTSRREISGSCEILSHVRYSRRALCNETTGYNESVDLMTFTSAYSLSGDVTHFHRDPYSLADSLRDFINFGEFNL